MELENTTAHEGSDRKQALVGLLAKIRAGAFLGMSDFVEAFPYVGHRKEAYHAFSFSLDCAKRLHEAVLPNFLWKINCSNATVYPFNAPDTGSGFYGMADNPARAWLCAIIQALIAKEDAPTDHSAG